MYTEFTDKAWARIGQLLKNNTHVKSLNISQCELESGLESLMVGGLLERETPLTSLCITGNQQVFYYEGCKVLAKYLQKNKKIEDLDLDESDVTPDELRLIMPALDGSQIKDLNFSRGMLQDDSIYKQAAHNSGITPSWNGVLKIFEEIHLPELTHIMFDHCQGGGDLCKAIAHLLKKKDSKLTHVDLRSNYLYGTCLDILKDALKDNTTLKHLDLSYNEDIEDWVGEWITELRETNSPLQVKYDL